jgi:chromate transporter
VNGATLLALAWRFAALSLIAVGGANALVPAIHAQAVDATHWLTPIAFTESIALAQAAPGPNLLLVPLVGWHVAGVSGAFVALLAFVIPSSILAVAGARFLLRRSGERRVDALRWALRPVGGGLMLSSSIAVFASAARAWPSPHPWVLPALAVIAVATALATWRWPINPLAWIAIAAVLGAVVPLG